MVPVNGGGRHCLWPSIAGVPGGRLVVLEATGRQSGLAYVGGHSSPVRRCGTPAASRRSTSWARSGPTTVRRPVCPPLHVPDRACGLGARRGLPAGRGTARHVVTTGAARCGSVRFWQPSPFSHCG
ncbi:hypothetical protein [Streptomyces composti]|uniref:hypothetical protein n=1 Tax=Streptomyces composti TaxID=2720025 RepID=UPI00359CA9E1